VYKSYDLGKLFSGKEDKIKAIHIAFTREILKLDDVKVNYFFTNINSKYLEDKKVTIFGKYNRPTKKVDVKKFIDYIDGYYNVLCAWKLTHILNLKNCTFILGGFENIYPTNAFNELTSDHIVKIVYGGDRTDPLLSTADILLKELDLLLHDTYRPLREDTIEHIITYDDKVKTENVFYHYIGNPDIEDIKPIEERTLSIYELNNYIRRPIIFVSAGSLPYQNLILEELPIYNEVFNKAYGLHASVRKYDPKIDSKIIGKNSEHTDYFLSLGKEADEQLELLKRGKSNIKELKIR